MDKYNFSLFNKEMSQTKEFDKINKKTASVSIQL